MCAQTDRPLSCAERGRARTLRGWKVRALPPGEAGASGGDGVLARPPARAFAGDDRPVDEELAAPDSPRFAALERPVEAGDPQRAVTTQCLGPLHLLRSLGEPEFTVVRAAGQARCLPRRRLPRHRLRCMGLRVPGLRGQGLRGRGLLTRAGSASLSYRHRGHLLVAAVAAGHRGGRVRRGRRVVPSSHCYFAGHGLFFRAAGAQADAMTQAADPVGIRGLEVSRSSASSMSSRSGRNPSARRRTWGRCWGDRRSTDRPSRDRRT